MPAETDLVTSATRRDVEVLQCQRKDVGGGGQGKGEPQQKACSRGDLWHLGSSPPPSLMRAGLLSGASDEVKSNDGVKELQVVACLRPCCWGGRFLMLKTMSWITFCARVLCRHKTRLPHRTHS